MNDAQYARLSKRIETRLRYWQRVMFLGAWRIQCDVYRDTRDFPDGMGGAHAAAVVHPEWEYLRATISFNAPTMLALSVKEFDEVVIHELVHCLLAPVSGNTCDGHGGDLSEMVTSTIALVIQHVAHLAD